MCRRCRSKERRRTVRRRDWIKAKRYPTADCVVIGIAGEGDTPRLVLALRHEDGVLHHLKEVCELQRSGGKECETDG